METRNDQSIMFHDVSHLQVSNAIDPSSLLMYSAIIAEVLQQGPTISDDTYA